MILIKDMYHPSSASLLSSYLSKPISFKIPEADIYLSSEKGEPTICIQIVITEHHLPIIIQYLFNTHLWNGNREWSTFWSSNTGKFGISSSFLEFPTLNRYLVFSNWYLAMFLPKKLATLLILFWWKKT